ADVAWGARYVDERRHGLPRVQPEERQPHSRRGAHAAHLRALRPESRRVPDPREPPNPGRPDGVPAPARVREFTHQREERTGAEKSRAELAAREGDAMSPKLERVERELLAMGFRAYPRGLLNGFVFACLTVALMWPGLPHSLLEAWFAGFIAIGLCRLAMARAFVATPPEAIDHRRWKRLAAFGYASVGFAWGVL